MSETSIRVHRLVRSRPAKDELPPADSERPAGLKSWALVELFGHKQIVGWVTVDPAEFPGMVRVDVPDLKQNGEVVRKGFTRYLGMGALYGVNPIDEASVRELLPMVDGKPARPASLTDY